MLYYKNYLIKPIFNALIAVPPIATEIEIKAVEEAFIKVGFSNIFLIEKPLANASGCNVDIFSHQPNLIIDLGGGLIELAIVGGGGIIGLKSLKTAGEHMNKLIYNYLYLKYGIILGESTCENLKINLMNFENEDKTVAIRGKSLETGLPKTIRVKTTDIKEALLTNFNQIIDNIKELIESSPPEILDELLKRGLILVGGLSRIKGIDKFLSRELKINVFINDLYEDTTIEGLLKLTKEPKIVAKLAMKF
jgi:rod shape-determining protein MreB